MSWYMAPRPLTSLLCEVSRARRRQCFARRRYYYDVPEKINLSHLIVTQSLIFIISSVVMTNKKTTHRDCRECNANKWPDAKKTSFKVYISIGRKTCMNALHYVSFENRYCVKRRCRSCTDDQNIIHDIKSIWQNHNRRLWVKYQREIALIKKEGSRIDSLS